MNARSFTSPGARHVAATLVLGMALLSAGSAFALGTGEIPNVRAITVCLQRHKANLSEACRSAMEQAGY
jgi:hypothetical protein